MFKRFWTDPSDAPAGAWRAWRDPGIGGGRPPVLIEFSGRKEECFVLPQSPAPRVFFSPSPSLFPWVAPPAARPWTSWAGPDPAGRLRATTGPAPHRGGCDCAARLGRGADRRGA